MATPTADELDARLRDYLLALDAYMQARDELSSLSKQAFMSLAKAKHHLGSNHARPALSNAQLHPQALVRITDSDETSTVSYDFTAAPYAAPDDEEQAEMPKSAYADPIRLMAGLPPPSLRDAQRYFRGGAKEVLHLASLASQLRSLEVEIRRMRTARRDVRPADGDDAKT